MTTVKELRNIAKGRNIKSYSKMRRADLIRVLHIETPLKIQTSKRFKKNCKRENYKRLL